MSAENSAVLTLRRLTEAIVARDLGAYADGLAEGYQYEDRRKGMQSTHGKSEEVEQARAIGELGVERIDFDVLETRGEHMALCRFTTHAAGFEVALLLVSRVADGKGVAAIVFDEEDFDAARAELEAQSAAL